MVAVSVTAVHYSQEARIYMIGTAALWLFFVLVENGGRGKNKIALSSLLVFSFISHHIAGIVAISYLITKFLQSLLSLELEEDSKVFSGGNFRRLMRSKSGDFLSYLIVTMVIGLLNLRDMVGDSDSNTLGNWISPTPNESYMVLINAYFGYPSWGDTLDGLGNIVWTLIVLSPFLLLISNLTGANRRGFFEQPEWPIWATSFFAYAFIIAYSEIVRPLFVLRYTIFFMPAWFLMFSMSIFRSLEFLSGFKKNESVFNRIDVISVFISFSLLLVSSQWLVHDYEYYERQTKSDFRSVAVDLDELQLPSESSYIIAAPNPWYWNQYFDRLGSEEEVDFGRYGAIGGPAYTYVAVNQPNYVVYALAHNPSSFFDQNLVTFLTEKHGYEQIEHKSYYQSEYYLFYKDSETGG